MLGFNIRAITIIINNIFIFLFVYKKSEKNVTIPLPTNIGLEIRHQRKLNGRIKVFIQKDTLVLDFLKIMIRF